MKKIVLVLVVIIALSSVASFAAYATETDAGSETEAETRRERETFTDYVEIPLPVETEEGDAWNKIPPFVLPDETQEETRAPVEPAPELSWEERGRTVSLEGVFDLDIQKKIKETRNTS